MSARVFVLAPPPPSPESPCPTKSRRGRPDGSFNSTRMIPYYIIINEEKKCRLRGVMFLDIAKSVYYYGGVSSLMHNACIWSIYPQPSPPLAGGEGLGVFPQFFFSFFLSSPLAIGLIERVSITMLAVLSRYFHAFSDPW